MSQKIIPKTENHGHDAGHSAGFNRLGFFNIIYDTTNIEFPKPMITKAGKEMKKEGRGKIISLSSIGGGTVGFPTGSVYCASKAAIAALTQTLAVELAPFKINVNCICPGNVLSPMNQHLFDDKEYEDLMLSLTPWGRIGKINDITPAVLYLASDESDYVTGIKLVVDGGWSSP